VIWTNTALFGNLIPKEKITEDKIKATSIILGAFPIDINEFPNVKFVFRAGVGADNINFSNVRIEFPSNETKDLIYEETANFTSYLIFKMLYDHLGCLNTWSGIKRNITQDKNLLILGGGNIGSKVYDKMSPFFKNISIYDIKVDPTPPDYSNADIITLHIPYNSQNKGFINKKILKQCKDDLILINTARGGLVEEDDLYDILIKTDMRAAFDVFWEEPYTGKLTTLSSNKFFMTPHIASSSIEFAQRCYEDFKQHYGR
jgi:D-3-phosphoglycerate dehydrogenase